jgi:hypothetical protein
MGEDDKEIIHLPKEDLEGIFRLWNEPKARKLLEYLDEGDRSHEGISEKFGEDPEVRGYLESLTREGLAYAKSGNYGLTCEGRDKLEIVEYFEKIVCQAKSIFSVEEYVRIFCGIYEAQFDGLSREDYASLFDNVDYRNLITPAPESVEWISKIPRDELKNIASSFLIEELSEYDFAQEKDGRVYHSDLGAFMIEMYCLSKGYTEFSRIAEDDPDGDKGRAAVEDYIRNDHTFP